MNPLPFKPYLHPPVAVGLPAMLLTAGNLCRQSLIPIWFVHPLEIVVIPAAGYAEEPAHSLYRILFPFPIDRQIFHRCFHLLPASRRKSRSNSFSIFSRRISLSFSCSVVTYPLGGLPRRRGKIPASIFLILRLYSLTHSFTTYLSLNPNCSAISWFVFPNAFISSIFFYFLYMRILSCHTIRPLS